MKFWKQISAAIVLGAASAAFIPRVSAAQDAPASAAAQANNPLAAFNTFNLQNQYTGELTGSGQSANSFFLRGATPVSAFGGDWLVRYTLPINRFPDPTGGNATGIGDFNVFAAYLIDTGNPSLSFGVGPQLTAPTATEDGTGAGKWSLGLANVLFSAANPKFQWGYLLTWQASVAGASQSRPDVNAGAFQPLLIAQLGKGWYLRSTAIWTYDFETDNYNIPIGLGAGRVVKTKKAVVNYFIEPQVSVASRGPGQADWGVFAGVNFQFPK